jgi:cell division protein FtsB
MTERWKLPNQEVMEEALELIARMQKHEQLTLLERENKQLKHEVYFLREHIKNLTTKQKEE